MEKQSRIRKVTVQFLLFWVSSCASVSLSKECFLSFLNHTSNCIGEKNKIHENRFTFLVDRTHINLNGYYNISLRITL